MSHHANQVKLIICESTSNTVNKAGGDNMHNVMSLHSNASYAKICLRYSIDVNIGCIYSGSIFDLFAAGSSTVSTFRSS